MEGEYEIIVKKRNLTYNLRVKSNITILSGDSATGKTVLIKAIQDYQKRGKKSGIHLSCEKKCKVFSGYKWERDLQDIKDSIVFIDDGSEYIASDEFAEAIKNSDNYYVIATRRELSNIPHSTGDIYKLECENISSTGVYNKQSKLYTADKYY